MSDKKAYSGLSKLNLTVPAKSVSTVDYVDTKPNYFRVQNKSANTTIYCGTAHIPTATDYDFMVAKQSLKLFAEPYQRTKLYIFNPSASDVGISVLSLSAEYDPLTLAMSDIEISIPQEITSSGAVSSFECSLPAGTAKLGKVDIDSALPAGTNHIGNVTVTNPVNVSSISDNLGYLLQNSSHDGQYNLFDLYNVLEMKARPYLYAKAGTLTGAGETYEAESGFYIDEISYLSNDSDTVTITAELFEGSSSQATLTIKPGEVLNNIPCGWNKITLTGTGAAYRMTCIKKGRWF